MLEELFTIVFWISVIVAGFFAALMILGISIVFVQEFYKKAKNNQAVKFLFWLIPLIAAVIFSQKYFPEKIEPTIGSIIVFYLVYAIIVGFITARSKWER